MDSTNNVELTMSPFEKEVHEKMSAQLNKEMSQEVMDNLTTLMVGIPRDLNPLTGMLVVGFATALANKLFLAQKKYGYTDGWTNDTWMDTCRESLMEHLEKGDPRDVAAFCAFLWYHGESTK